VAQRIERLWFDAAASELSVEARRAFCFRAALAGHIDLVE